MRQTLSVLAACAALLVGGCARYTYPPNSNKQPAPQEKPRYNLGKLARQVHRRVNAARSERNHEKLSWNATLARLARAHSRDMAEQSFFAHENPDGQNATERGREADFSCRLQQGDQTYTGIAENLFYTSPYRSYQVTRSGDSATTQYMWKASEEIASEIVQGWMQSPGHRRNLLNAQHQSEGIGLARGEDEEGNERIYVTQDFC